MRILIIIILQIVVIGTRGFSQSNVERASYLPPEKVSVLPIIHVPRGVSAPERVLASNVSRHLKWTQRRYGELLGTTFEIADESPMIFRGKYTLAEYREFKNLVGAYVTAQHLEHLNVNRFNCPYILFTVFYNPNEDWPSGRGGPMNGGFGTGGGTLLISSHVFQKLPNAQSTLQHELGHAFGLPHIDAYGFPLRGNNPSIMGYNKRHHTNRFRPSAFPGVFIPEDIRGLALNDAAIPELDFSPNADIPGKYQIHKRVQYLGAAKYPGQRDYVIRATTDAGETNASRIENVVIGPILHSPGPAITFDQRSMWHSGKVDTASITLEFPFAVELSKIRVYTGHSGNIHRGQRLNLYRVADSKSYYVGQTVLNARDGVLSFEPTLSQVWRLELKSGQSGKIVVRGIRFWSRNTEIFRSQVCLVQPK